MKGTLLVLLLAVPVLAGCLAGSDDATVPGVRPPAASLLCEPACNVLATVAPAQRQANELTIAVNPLDPDNILASGKDYTPAEAGDCVRDGIYVTHDGGRTWTNGNVPGSPWRLAQDPAAYQHDEDLSRFWCVTDPVLAFGPDGTAYWAVMPYQCDPVSGSKTGREFVPGTGVGHPDGGFNDWLWTCSSMYVLVSEDGGDTWPVVREVAFGPRLEHDKQWLSVAPDGTALLCWDRDPSYQLASLVGPGGNAASQLSPGGVMSCSVSKDKGRTWSPVTDVNPEGTWVGFLPWVDWGPDGTAWMAAIDGERVLVGRSGDGLAWSEPVAVGAYRDPPPNGEFGWAALRGSAFRTFALPSLAVDRSDGPYAGSVYVAWFDHSGGDGEILLAHSRDGKTWSVPTRIHDDDPAAAFDQFMPAIAVGPDGTVDAVWYDRRDDPANHLFALYHAYSTDGGATWSRNLRVGEVLVDERFSHHQNGMVFMGDYIDLDSTAGRAYPVWVDTRDGKADAYVAVVERPGANG